MHLTPRQKAIVDYIEEYVRKKGYAPTLAEIGRRFRLRSLATVHKHLCNLERKGAIKRSYRERRAIELTSDVNAPRAMAVPLLGRVAAGRPVEAVETVDEIALPEEMVGYYPTYALRVVGDSMVEDGILDGDYIVVEERPVPQDGDTVIALIGDEATVKRFYRHGKNQIRLQPANERLEPMIVNADAVRVRGVVTAVLRRY